MKKSEVARLFGVSLSSVKRYVRKFRQGKKLAFAGQSTRQTPEGERGACQERLLLEADLKERPFGKLHQRCEYLEALALA